MDAEHDQPAEHAELWTDEEVAAALTKPGFVAKWRAELGSIAFFLRLLEQRFAVVGG